MQRLAAEMAQSLEKVNAADPLAGMDWLYVWEHNLGMSDGFYRLKAGSRCAPDRAPNPVWRLSNLCCGKPKEETTTRRPPSQIAELGATKADGFTSYNRKLGEYLALATSPERPAARLR